MAGMLTSAAGMTLLSTMDAATSRLESSLYMLVLGLGIGMVMQVLVLAMQNASEPQDMGVVTSSANFFSSLGGSMGISVFRAIFASLPADRLGAFLPPGALDGAGFNPASLPAGPSHARRPAGGERVWTSR